MTTPLLILFFRSSTFTAATKFSLYILFSSTNVLLFSIFLENYLNQVYFLQYLNVTFCLLGQLEF
jgi:hypothetical protein